MMFYKSLRKHKALLMSAILVSMTLLILGVWLLPKTNKIPLEDFNAPTRAYSSPKKVEDYFVSNLRMTLEDLKQHENREKVSFYVTKDNTLEAITGNLTYYGLARNKEALQYALEHTEDKNGGKDEAIRVSNTGSIDINAFYTISEDMTAWELADTLLNEPNFYGSHGDYGYMFMP